MANPLIGGGKGIPVPMQNNVNAFQNVMGRLHSFQNMMNNGGANFNPQQMVMNSMQNDSTASQGIQALRDKYGKDKSAVEIAQAVCKENGLDYNQMAAMFSRGFPNNYPLNGKRR